MGGELIRGEWLPQALSIGVDYKLFWSLNPNTIKPFFEAFRISQKRNIDNINTSAWLNGVYVLKALSAGFGKGKYDTKPIELETEENEQMAQANTLNKYAQFSALADEWNKIYRAKHKEDLEGGGLNG